MFMRFSKLFVLINVVSTSFAQNDYCQEGTYGNNCELHCPEKCRPLETYPCNKKTGKCSEGCRNGYYGDHCDMMCRCVSGVCFQEDGECIGTGTTTVKNTIENITSTTAAPEFDGVAAGWRTIAIILIIFIILLVCGGVVVFFCVRLKKQENSLTGRWGIRFCKAANANEERGTGPAEILLKQDESGVEAKGDHPEILKPRGDQSEETLQTFKPSTELAERDLKIKQLKEEKRQAEDKCAKMKEALSRYEYREKVIQGLLDDSKPPTMTSMSTNLLMSNKGLNKDHWLHCPHLMFDTETVNVKVAQIDDNMVLWNIPDTRNPENNSRRFQNFQGAISTEPLVNTGLYQYFEAMFDIALHQPVGEGIIAQVGLVGDKDKEPITPFIDTRKHCFVVEVASSEKQDKICLLLINNGKTEHMLELMNNISGSKHKVHIGIRLRKDRKRIQIFDCGAMKSVQKNDIHLGEKIWPVFGVCAQNEVSVNVQLIAGRDIEMGKEKKKMVESKYMLQ